MGYADEKKQRKRLSLMDSALSLFTTQGIAKTSIEDIAKKAGVAKGTFYLYFRDKYDLHERLVIHESEELVRQAAERSGCRGLSGAENKLIALVDDMLFQLRDNRRLLQFFNRNLSWGVLHRAVDQSETDLRPVFEDIFGPGTLDDEACRVELFTILEMIGSTCHSVILDGDPVDLDTYLPYLHRSIRAVMNSFQAA